MEKMTMKIRISGDYMTCTRESGDPKFYGTIGGKGESAFLYYLKIHLNTRGYSSYMFFTEGSPFEFIGDNSRARWKKIRMWKHGHMVDDLQQYLFADTKAGRIALYNGSWAIRGLNDDWNSGECQLIIAR
jgi:hypothetical protein